MLKSSKVKTVSMWIRKDAPQGMAEPIATDSRQEAKPGLSQIRDPPELHSGVCGVYVKEVTILRATLSTEGSLSDTKHYAFVSKT